MNIEEAREACIAIKGATETFPFGEDVLVYKIMDKMYAYMALDSKDGEFWLNLKCDPEKAIELREEYTGIKPGFHSNKKYWNTIVLDSDVPDKLIKELILHSVDEVIKKLPKVKQTEYNNLPNS
ncbi:MULTISPECIES: MmcQ/YjbR family DNA-binding protein [Dysgonomonas]|uniref:MmcQ/YjbR family DNA-binding protein n=1 Tax=Dysgonomonas TaxID=156973 RepID=UPI00092CAEBD|nr:MULTISPECIES: MmcQ/YjbR family DNA-binding protein [Dysgonomonas]MBN9303030.1 MmcQ/YjbR family DNA-binding protein [Dysgonomonas mossii]OJX58545.1 MAG: cytoplasmic protein [Dysgonomonas sp. 37-18]